MAHIFVVCLQGSVYHTIQLDKKQQVHTSTLSILNTSYSFQEKNWLASYVKHNL